MSRDLPTVIPDSAADHERRATRVNMARDLSARWVALMAFYGCARREIHAKPFDWGIDPRALAWRTIMNESEQPVWEALKASGMKFYPQFPIGRFFVDFACPAARTVIECDGLAYRRDWSSVDREHEIRSRNWAIFRIDGRDCLDDSDDTEDSPSPLWAFIRNVKRHVDGVRSDRKHNGSHR